eukprot:9494077-Pyramimonas_sp.AAC.1
MALALARRALKSEEWRSGKIQDHQNATVRLIRGVGIPRTMSWHGSGSSNGCLPTKKFHQWKRTVVGAYEEGAWREGLLQHR